MYSSLVRRTTVRMFVTSVLLFPAVIGLIWLMPWLAQPQRWFVFLLLLTVLPALAIVSHFRDRRRWEGADLHCRQCQAKYDRATAEAAIGRKICPRCGQYPFEPNDAKSAFSEVDPATIQRPPQDADVSEPGEPPREVNPYAPPRDAGPAPHTMSLLQFPMLWFSTVIKSMGTVLSGRRRMLDYLNDQLRNLDGGSLSPEYEQSAVSSHRRFAAWYLLWVLLFPIVITASSAIAINTLGGVHLVQVALTAMVFVVSAIVGLFIHSASISLGPRRLNRWLRGNPPPMSADRDEDTGFYGIRLMWTGTANEATRPRLRVEFRTDAAADIRVCLVNTAEATQFETVIVCSEPATWTEAEVDFAQLLQEANSEFTGNEIRLVPPDDVKLEIDGFQIITPPQPTSGVMGNT